MARVRHDKGAGDYLLAHMFQAQREAFTDPASRVAIYCSRRAGKTEGAASILCYNAIEYPGSVQAYVAPTKKQARKLIWPKLKRIIRYYDLDASTHEQHLELRFANGSVIYLLGLDTEADVDKARGEAFTFVLIDEAQMIGRTLDSFIEEVIEPALMDYGGRIFLTGTPHPLCTGYYYEACTGKQKGWSVHHWTLIENEKFPIWEGKDDWQEVAQKYLDDFRESKGWPETHPRWLREYRGQWVRDFGSMMYQYVESRNSGRYLDLSDEERASYRHILGVDLGFKDATAFVVASFSELSPQLYLHSYYKKSGCGTEEVAGIIKSYVARFNFLKIQVDTGGLGAMIVNDLRVRHGIPCTAAEKKHKLAFIETFNSDMEAGHVLAEPGELVDEWLLLQKMEDGKEDPRQDNHLCDAALYAARESRHYRFLPKEEGPEYGTKEYWERYMKKMEMREALEPPEDLDEEEALWV